MPATDDPAFDCDPMEGAEESKPDWRDHLCEAREWICSAYGCDRDNLKAQHSSRRLFIETAIAELEKALEVLP